MSLNLLPHSTHLLKFSLKRSRKFSASIPKSDRNTFYLSPSSSSLLPTSAIFSPLSLDGDATARHLAQAVKEDQTPYTSSGEKSETPNPSKSSSKLVFVIGGSGGVGQLVVASLLSRGIKSRLLLRDPSKAVSLFGEQDGNTLEVWKGDMRNPNDLDPAMFEGVTHVICCTGTTAFPSRRWDGDNTPEKIDWEGIRNLVNALPRTLRRLIFVSSVGVTKYNELPWSIMNLFGVLKFKKMAEDFIRNSGIPFTIIRAGRLTDGPYTSYDLNTLLKATAGERRAVVIDQGDNLVGEVSRLVVAEACLQAMDIEFTEGQIYEINSVKGDGPGCDTVKWRQLFKAAQANKPSCQTSLI